MVREEKRDPGCVNGNHDFRTKGQPFSPARGPRQVQSGHCSRQHCIAYAWRERGGPQKPWSRWELV